MITIDKKAISPFSYNPEQEYVYPDISAYSLYIQSFDGTLLAVNVTLPVDPSNTVQKKFPVILIANRRSRKGLMIRNKL